MRAHPFHALVFDFDGTLADTAIDFAGMKLALYGLVREYLPHAPLPGDTPALEWLRAMKDALPGDARRHIPAIERRAADIIRAAEIHAAECGALFPFTRPLLAALRADGIATAVITRNCTDAVLTLFPDIHAAADVFLSRDDIANVKPHPDHVGAALRAIGIAPQHALMVGDHPLDIETGRHSGTATAGVLTGQADRARFLACGAHHIADDADALVRALRAEGRLVPAPPLVPN